MSKYRALFGNEYIYGDRVEVEAPCGEPYYAGILVDGYKGIPIYKQVSTETVERKVGDSYCRLSREEIENIKTVLNNTNQLRYILE